MHFDIDADGGSKAISPYIYGVNEFQGILDGMPGDFANCKLVRNGGNRFTAYNWTNNASNAGTDYNCQSDNYLVSGPILGKYADVPDGANIPIINFASSRKAAVLLTLPINGLVAADMCNMDVRLSGPDFMHQHFVPEMPVKNTPFTLKPDPHSKIVYQDEFVNYINQTYPYSQTDPQRPIWFDLDNEPDLWSSTHPEIHPDRTTYTELVDKSIAYSAAVKAVMPNALIFGAVSYGWDGYVRLQGASDGGGRDFLEFFLQQMAQAEQEHHKRLMDALDVHWYPEAKGGGIRIVFEKPSRAPAVLMARMQAPRSLWDPTYLEESWIVQDQLHAAIRLIPRLREKIEKNYPGTKLSISEYLFGGGSDISGAIAEADALGIFGREGVFAAALWPEENMPFIGAAFAMYRNFDGHDGSFGDRSLAAKTSDIQSSSIYASRDSKHPGRMVIVLINKTDGVLPADVRLHGVAIGEINAFQLTESSAHPVRSEAPVIAQGNSFSYAMPAYSVSTILIEQKQ